MKMYNKPEFFVTEFAPNEAVTACPVDNTYDFDQQTVTCFIDGSETIFLTETACGEGNAVSAGNGIVISGKEVAWTMATQYQTKYDPDKYWRSNDGDNERFYYAWVDDKSMNQPGDNGTAFSGLMDILAGFLGYTSSTAPGNEQVVHGGWATAKMISERNQS